MGSKALIRLLIIFAAVGAVALIVKFTGPGTVETVTGGIDREKVFPEFPATVDRIRIKTADAEVNLIKGEKTWEVAERDNHPADQEEIVGFVRKVWDLDIIQAPEIGPSQFGRLELIDPDKGGLGVTATVVSFQNAEGKELKSLWLGKIYGRSEGRPSPFGGTSTTEVGRYVRTGDEEKVFLVDESFSDIEPDPAGWLSEDFFKVEKIKTIAIESKPREGEGEGDVKKDAWAEADNWKLTREEVTADFTLVDAAEGEELDSTKVSSMKSAFSGPRFDDVVAGEEAKQNQPDLTTFTVETFDGFTYKIKASKKDPGGELYLTYAVDGKFPDKREPGEEESDEEKTRLDQEFDDNLKAQREKLAKEKAVAGKVYKVRGFVVDSITKKRSELFKEEEKPAVGGPASGIPGLPNIPGLPPGTIQLPKDGSGVPLNLNPATPAPDPAPKPDGDAGATDKPEGKKVEPPKPSDEEKTEKPKTDDADPKPATDVPEKEMEAEKPAPDAPAKPEPAEEKPAKPDAPKPANKEKPDTPAKPDDATAKPAPTKEKPEPSGDSASSKPAADAPASEPAGSEKTPEPGAEDGDDS